MKTKTLTGLAALTLFDIAAAHAQAPVPSWTGYYVGVNAGGRASKVDASGPFSGFPADQGGNTLFDNQGNPLFPLFFASFTAYPTGGVAGVHGGYNSQYTVDRLIGWEVDINWGKNRTTNSFSIGNLSVNGTGTVSFSTTVDWSASLRGRFGAVWGPWLFYGTGGISIIRMTISPTGNLTGGGAFGCGDGFTCIFGFNSSSNSSSSKILLGAIGGLGTEYMVDHKWTFRVEYLFSIYPNVDFGNATITNTYADNFICGCSTTSTSSGPLSAGLFTQVLRVGLSMKIP